MIIIKCIFDVKNQFNSPKMMYKVFFSTLLDCIRTKNVALRAKQPIYGSRGHFCCCETCTFVSIIIFIITYDSRFGPLARWGHRTKKATTAGKIATNTATTVQLFFFNKIFIFFCILFLVNSHGFTLSLLFQFFTQK